MIKTTVQKNQVTLKMDKGDYRLIRIILENAKATSPDANVRMGITDLILPNMPEVVN